MKWHELKTDSEVFQAVRSGEKTYEIRFNDRDYQRHDFLRLCETERTGEEMREGAQLIYTGDEIDVKVTHILRGPVYGLKDMWVIMSIKPV